MPPGNDGEASYMGESGRLSNGNDATGFAVTSHPKLSSVFPSRKYVAVGSETEDPSPEVGYLCTAVTLETTLFFAHHGPSDLVKCI